MDGIYIDIPVFDVAVKNLIEAILEDENILLHSQLNPKVFRLRIDDLLELFTAFEVIMTNEDGFSRSVMQEKIVANINSGNYGLRDILSHVEPIGSFEDFKKMSLKAGAEKTLNALAAVASTYPIIMQLINAIRM